MLGQLDKNKPYGTVYGMTASCKFVQDGKYFAGNGDEIPESIALMNAADVEKMQAEPVETPAVDVIAELNQVKDPNAAPGDEGPDPPKMIGKGTRLDYEVLLQRYTSHALKRVLIKEGLEPITGVGSTAQNIALLLDHKFPEGE